MFRLLDEQFEPEVAERIRALIARINNLGIMDGPERYFAYELQQCLQAGLLLAALHVTCSLLELRIRHLALFRHSQKSQQVMANPNLGILQAQLEDDRRKTFKVLVATLEATGLISSHDAEVAKHFYDSVRIPIHHAIVARYARSRGSTGWADLVDSHITMQDFENALESSAITEIEAAVSLMDNYRY